MCDVCVRKPIANIIDIIVELSKVMEHKNKNRMKPCNREKKKTELYKDNRKLLDFYRAHTKPIFFSPFIYIL